MKSKATMKSTHVAAASGFVLALALAAPALAADQQTQAGEAGKSQHGIEKSLKESPLGAGTSATGMEQSAQSKQKRADKISGTEVVNSAGKKIGEVEKVVRERGTSKDYAVVGVGGFLGIGEKEVTIPLRDLRMEGEHLVAPLASTEKELEARPAYEEKLYEEVPGEEMVSLGTTGKGKGGAEGSSFAQLDIDGNGYLSKLEAKDDTRLTEEWSQIDTNHDERIDRAEFAAFETGVTMKSPEKGATSGKATQGEQKSGAGTMQHEEGGSGSGY
jgi:sporulation protein YlmC with PRC-barrel domain